jgi:glycosyltransferase involved in cell wall biosynthesis
MFDSQYLENQDFLQNSNQLEKKFFVKGIGAEFLADPYVKTCTTTTEFLAEKLRSYDKQVFIVPNKLSGKDLKIAEKINSGITRNNFKVIRIGYFSGTHSHDKDFATITSVLVSIMEKYPNVELLLAGPLEIEKELDNFSSRIKRFPYAQRKDHFRNIASVDINIAPLEIENPFCQARSELKFFEAGIVKCPTVAAATQTFCNAIDDGINGFVASDSKEWFEKLEKLIVNKELRKSIGEKAWQKAMKKYSTENSNDEEYYAYLKSKIR